MITIASRIVRWRLRKITFPKLPPIKYNRLWNVTQKVLMKINLLEFIKILKKIILDDYGLTSILTIPAIALIIKNSSILEEKDTDSHLKMFKALNSDDNKVNTYFKWSLIFILIQRIIEFIIKLILFPLKLAILFYILDYLNFDINYLYHTINNLSLGTIDWYYLTLIDFLESLTIKNYIIMK